MGSHPLLSRNLQPYVAYRYVPLCAETNIAKKVNWGQGFSQNATEFVSAHDYIHRLQNLQVMQPIKSFEPPYCKFEYGPARFILEK